MPTYTYRCKICQITHSHTHGMTENPCPPCPRCGGFSERIVGSAPAVIKPEAAPTVKTAAPEISTACALHPSHQHGPQCKH